MTGFADEAMAALQRYRWPGNVRELQNVVERAVLLGKGPIITRGRPAGGSSRHGAASSCSSAAGMKTLKEALEGPERQIIREVLEANGWNRNATADPSASTARRSTRR